MSCSYSYVALDCSLSDRLVAFFFCGVLRLTSDLHIRETESIALLFERSESRDITSRVQRGSDSSGSKGIPADFTLINPVPLSFSYKADLNKPVGPTDLSAQRVVAMSCSLLQRSV